MNTLERSRSPRYEWPTIDLSLIVRAIGLSLLVCATVTGIVYYDDESDPQARHPASATLAAPPTVASVDRPDAVAASLAAEQWYVDSTTHPLRADAAH